MGKMLLLFCHSLVYRLLGAGYVPVQPISIVYVCAAGVWIDMSLSDKWNVRDLFTFPRHTWHHTPRRATKLLLVCRTQYLP
jgi:hypothetical protein